MNYLFTIAIASLLFISCSEDQYVRTYKVNKEFNKEVNEQASIPITWSAPISWIQPESLIPMSIASYKIPYYGYDPSKIDYADLSISILSDDGGGLEKNVNRWRGQVGLPNQTRNEIISSAERENNSLGEYQIFKIINKSNSDRAFICAVMPMEDSTIFVKLSIPKVGILSVEKDFLDFCQSFKVLGE